MIALWLDRLLADDLMTARRTLESELADESALREKRAAVEEATRVHRLEEGELEDRLRQGGGADKIERQHQQGKLTARERIAGLCDEGSRFVEVGLLVAHDEYEGQAPGAGVVTGATAGRISGMACGAAVVGAPIAVSTWITFGVEASPGSTFLTLRISGRPRMPWRWSSASTPTWC